MRVADPMLADRLRAAAAALCWRQNLTYTDQAFLARYRYCELVGPTGHARDHEHAMGLLYLAPHTTYPAHAHPASESYHVLTDGSQWSAAGSPWQDRRAGERIVHGSNVIHAMRTTRSALLAIYVWGGDLTRPATLLS
ncbi:MAG: hypothetical protein HC809_08390 [Gammaproteobacteria bacterium]|nr:hypothetical protein [Gammaproteobacteria bacterium]